jgi:uncharacterized protein DUF6445
LLTTLALSKDIIVEKVLIGDEKTPLLIIDNFVNNPKALIESANNKHDASFKAMSSDYYPGIRKTAPDNYLHLLGQLNTLLSSAFNNQEACEINTLMSAFSIATMPEKQLRPIQMLPHFDSPNHLQFAVVHYLCPSEHGGTSFYQHKSTGYERITREKLSHYGKEIKQQAIAEKLHEHPTYINGNTKLFKRIHNVNARMNRAIIYPSNLLHSGNININTGLKADPKTGRLTISSFVMLEHS